MSKSFGSDEIGMTEEDHERIRQFSQSDGRRENILRGTKSMADELNRDESYLVNVLISNGHFPKFLADELDVDECVVQHHYENDCHDYHGGKFITLAGCHDLHRSDSDVWELAEERDMSEAAIKYHLDGDCTHDSRVVDIE